MHCLRYGIGLSLSLAIFAPSLAAQPATTVEERIQLLEAQRQQLQREIADLKNWLDANPAPDATRSLSTVLGAEPASITFTDTNQAQEVHLFQGAELIPVSQIQSTRFEGNEFVQAMFTVRKNAAFNSLLIIPNAGNVEEGIYPLYVQTAAGTITIPVRMDRGVPDIMPAEGIPTSERLLITLPTQVTLGQRLNLDVNGSEDRLYRWTLNGNPILEGRGQDVVSFVMATPGVNTIRLEEFENDTRVSGWEGQTNVVPEAPIAWTVDAGAPTEISAVSTLNLGGFNVFEWLVDGTTVGNGPQFSHVFTAPGAHTLTCRASQPSNPQAEFALREVTYAITVRQ